MGRNGTLLPPLNVPRQLTEAQSAYLAGFVDGEGTIRFRVTKRDGRDSNLSHSWNCSLEVYNTNLEVLKQIREWVGYGAIYWRDRENTGHKRVYHWGVYSFRAVFVLAQIAPFLIVKQRRALIVLELTALKQARRVGRWVAYEDEDLPRISRLLEEIKRENETGSLEVQLFRRPEDSETVKRVRSKSEPVKPGTRRTSCQIEGCGERIKKGTGGLCVAHAEHAKERNREARHRTIQCEECGIEIETDQPQTRFCSAKCQTWNSYKRRTGKGVAEQRTCAECGTPFETSVEKKRFCSLQCQCRAKYKERLQNGYFERRKANSQPPLIE